MSATWMTTLRTIGTSYSLCSFIKLNSIITRNSGNVFHLVAEEQAKNTTLTYYHINTAMLAILWDCNQAELLKKQIGHSY